MSIWDDCLETNFKRKPFDLRDQFEQTDTFLKFDECFRVYYTNLGGYHFVLDDVACFYLNGAFTMFQEFSQ